MPPAEALARAGELFRNGSVKLLSMQCAILAHGVAQQKVKSAARRMAQFAIAVNQRGGVGLQIAANRFIGVAQQCRRVGGFDFVKMSRQWKWVPVEKISAARSTIQGDLIRPKDKAG